MMRCILPFSECVYLLNGNCQDNGLYAPFNSDAKCFRITGKKKMLGKSQQQSSSIDPHDPLKVVALRKRELLRVFVASKCVGTLEARRDPVLRTINWCAEDGTEMGDNEYDAVENTLKFLGYKETNTGSQININKFIVL